MFTTIRNDKGLSLLEVLVAMLILAFGILGLAPMMVTTIFSNSYSGDVTRANVIAQDKIEFMQSFITFNPLPWTEVTSNLSGIFTRSTRVDIDSTDGTVPSGVYRIKVTVSWTDKAGKNRSVNYFTYKMRS